MPENDDQVSEDSISSDLSLRIHNQLSDYIDTVTGLTLAAMNAINDIVIDDSSVAVKCTFAYPIANRQAALTTDLKHSLGDLLGERQLLLDIKYNIQPTTPQTGEKALPQIKHIVAVASGKGGVGKSATTVNLALALQQEGARVGVLDADIYGPSLPTMLGIEAGARPEVIDQKYFMPIEAYGLQTMSMGYMVTEKTPMVWRGPMVSGALMQMINQTYWQSLDYLLIDMPPGTGDIQLTLAQQIPCSGAVVVTTPQNIALFDAKKGIEMFKKVGIPCLGIVENMAIHRCSECGHEEAIFGHDGGAKIADEYEVPLLGSLPLDASIREGLDQGKPTVADQPDSLITQSYSNIATKVAVQLFFAAKDTEQKGPEIIVSDD